MTRLLLYFCQAQDKSEQVQTCQYRPRKVGKSPKLSGEVQLRQAGYLKLTNLGWVKKLKNVSINFIVKKVVYLGICEQIKKTKR